MRMGLFKVKNRVHGWQRTVYDIKEIRVSESRTVLEFLVFADGHWAWVPADNYVPVEDKEGL